MNLNTQKLTYCISSESVGVSIENLHHSGQVIFQMIEVIRATDRPDSVAPSN